MSSVYTKEKVEHSDSSNDVLGDLNTAQARSGIDYCISVSCNSDYYRAYGYYFVESLKRLSDKFHCHISITDSLGVEIDDERFSISCQNISITDNVGPISSALRFIHALDMLDNSKVPVIVLDFDCVFLKSLKPLIESVKEYDIGLRILNNVLPWETYTGGMSIYNYSEHAIYFLKSIKQYLFEVVCLEKAQWWVDQNALEVAVRTSVIDGGAQIKNIFKDIPSHIYIPTGAKESKISQMENALALE